MANPERAIDLIHEIGRLAGERPVGNFHAFGPVYLTPELRTLYEQLAKLMPKFPVVAQFNGVSDETLPGLMSRLDRSVPYMARLRLLQAAKARGGARV